MDVCIKISVLNSNLPSATKKDFFQTDVIYIRKYRFANGYSSMYRKTRYSDDIAILRYIINIDAFKKKNSIYIKSPFIFTVRVNVYNPRLARPAGSNGQFE